MLVDCDVQVLFNFWPSCVTGFINQLQCYVVVEGRRPQWRQKPDFKWKKRSCATQEGGITSAAITPAASVTAALCRHLSPPPAPRSPELKIATLITQPIMSGPAFALICCPRPHLSFFCSPSPSPPVPTVVMFLTSRRQVIAAAAGVGSRFVFALRQRRTSDIFIQV